MNLGGLRFKLFAATGLILLATIGITFWLLNIAEDRLREQAFSQLRAVRETKAVQVEAELGQFVANLDALSQSRAAVEMLPRLAEGFHALDEPIDEFGLRNYYADDFQTRVPDGRYTTATAASLIPRSDSGKALQTLFISSNPHPVGEKDLLTDAGDGSEYSAAHAAVHPALRAALDSSGAYDIFLIDDETGHIVYSVFKEIDVGTSLESGPHAASGLGQAWAASVVADDLAIVDFAPYVPSYLAPAAFAAQGVYGPDATRLGTIAMQAPIDRINDVMTSEQRWSEIGLGESGETYIVAADGRMRSDSRFLIEDPERFYGAVRDEYGSATVDAIRRGGSTIGLMPVVTEGVADALDGNTGADVFPDYRGVDVLSDYGPLAMPGGLDWVIMSEIDAAEAFRAENDMRTLSFIVLLITGIVMFVGMWIVSSRLTRPLRVLEEETVRVKSLSFADGDTYDLSTLDDVAGRNDEIGDLAGAFSALVGSLQENVSQRIAIQSELNVAADIQQSLLPLIFPHQPEYTEFDLHAALVPAKEVGGDFYDFGEVGIDHYYFLVGDVSGKGVPAALFMAACKTLMRSGALSGEPPDQMLTRINAEIQESNSEAMFVTTWLGVLDLRTGEVVFTNAGHNPPLLRTAEGETRFLRERHGPFVGPVPGVAYTSGSFTMRPGDRLVVYSDGVTEAMHPDGTLFGEGRLEGMGLPEKVEDVTAAIVDAALAWEQGTRSDDVTVLALDFRSVREAAELSVTFSGQDPVAVISELNAAIDEFGSAHDVPGSAISKTMMGLDEVVTNVLTHGGATSVTVEVNWRTGLDPMPSWLVTTVRDNGMPFDPLSAPEPDITLGLHERTPGGLGIHLLRGLMSSLDYTYVDAQNVLTMTLEVPAE